MRGEKNTTIFVNNAIYGMTGGQMAPTTLVGQKATTAPFGRSKELYACPFGFRTALHAGRLRLCERVAVTDVPISSKRKKRSKRRSSCSRRRGFTFVEVLSTCPTNWGLTPKEAIDWLKRT
jgi:2-oxoglutarate ferredoxin oxidoreductase subunit beta